jgi:hypothetical protein
MDTTKYTAVLTASQRNELMYVLGEAKLAKVVTWSIVADDALGAVVNAVPSPAQDDSDVAENGPDDTLVSPTLPPSVGRPTAVPHWRRAKELAKTTAIVVVAMVAVVATMSLEHCIIGP